MIYTILKLLHILLASALVSGFILHIFCITDRHQFTSFLKKIFIPACWLQLIIGIGMSHIAGYPIFDEGWIFITLLILILCIFLAIVHVFYSNKLHRIMFFLLFTAIIFSFGLMILQPEIAIWMI